MVTVLYEASAIRSGYTLKDLNGFTRRVESVVRKTLGVDLQSEAKVEVVVAAEKSDEEREKDKEFLAMGEEAASAEAGRFDLDDEGTTFYDEL